MSDTVIIVTTVVTGVVTIATTIATFLTLWIKLKYGVEKAESVEAKVDDNTKKTEEVGRKADMANTAVRDVNKKLNGGLDSSLTAAIAPLHQALREHTANDEQMAGEHAKAILDHSSRISVLEKQVVVLQSSMDNLTDSIKSTRHEMRGHLQIIVTKLDILGVRPQLPQGSQTPPVVDTAPAQSNPGTGRSIQLTDRGRVVSQTTKPDSDVVATKVDPID